MKERISVVLVLVAGIAAPILAQTPQATPMPYTAIHQPEFVAASEATFLQDDDILLGVASGKVAKAFPAADLSQHGAVFDQLPDGPISVTWCGVCNTGLVFRAEVKGRTLHFQYDRMVGANEVQKDLETGTSWQQATGEAIDGPLKGTRLKLYPVVRTTWAEWRKRYPAHDGAQALAGIRGAHAQSEHGASRTSRGWVPKERRTARSRSTSDCRRGKPWRDSKSVARPWRTRSRSCASRVSSTTAWADCRLSSSISPRPIRRRHSTRAPKARCSRFRRRMTTPAP